MMLLSVCIIVITLPKQAKFRYDIEKGRIWNQKEVISPYNFAILKTPQEIESDEKTALSTITPIYQFDGDLAQHELDGFKNDLEVKWHSAGLNDKLKSKYIQTGYNLLNEIYARGVLKPNPKYQQSAEDYPITILSHNVATDKNTADLYTPEKALTYCSDELNKPD